MTCVAPASPTAIQVNSRVAIIPAPGLRVHTKSNPLVVGGLSVIVTGVRPTNGISGGKADSTRNTFGSLPKVSLKSTCGLVNSTCPNCPTEHFVVPTSTSLDCALKKIGRAHV